MTFKIFGPLRGAEHRVLRTRYSRGGRSRANYPIVHYMSTHPYPRPDGDYSVWLTVHLLYLLSCVQALILGTYFTSLILVHKLCQTFPAKVPNVPLNHQHVCLSPFLRRHLNACAPLQRSPDYSTYTPMGPLISHTDSFIINGAQHVRFRFRYEGESKIHYCG